MLKNYYKKIKGWFDFRCFYDSMVEQFDSGLFVELGTWQGKSLLYLAEKVKESGKDIKLVGIDTFEGTGGMLAESGMTSDQVYNKYLQNIEPFKDIITTHRGSTHDLHTLFKDESIDFLFIDADHSYEAVRKDIELWFPKVKTGGIISGHDYTTLYGYGVVRAVDEFFEGRKVKRNGNFVWYLTKHKEMIHPKGYWLVVEGENTHTFDQRLCASIVDIFKPFVKTAVDIGCGDGRYTKYLIKNGIKCKGYDGSPVTPQLSGGLCEVKDFADPQDIGKFDLVLSLEVGEHIPKEYEQIFIDNICNASNRYICLSWAIEGQPGYGHFNCRNNDYVISELAKKGFYHCAKSSQYLRDNCTQDKFPWFINTVMVFQKSST